MVSLLSFSNTAISVVQMKELKISITEQHFCQWSVKMTLHFRDFQCLSLANSLAVTYDPLLHKNSPSLDGTFYVLVVLWNTYGPLKRTEDFWVRMSRQLMENEQLVNKQIVQVRRILKFTHPDERLVNIKTICYAHRDNPREMRGRHYSLLSADYVHFNASVFLAY